MDKKENKKFPHEYRFTNFVVLCRSFAYACVPHIVPFPDTTAMVLAEKPFLWSAKTFPVPFFSCSCSCRARQGKFCKFFALTLAMLLVTIFYCFVEVTVFEKVSSGRDNLSTFL